MANNPLLIFDVMVTCEVHAETLEGDGECKKGNMVLSVKPCKKCLEDAKILGAIDFVRTDEYKEMQKEISNKDRTIDKLTETNSFLQTELNRLETIKPKDDSVESFFDDMDF